MEFLFLCSTRYLTCLLCSLLSYRVEHLKRNSISKDTMYYSLYLTSLLHSLMKYPVKHLKINSIPTHAMFNSLFRIYRVVDYLKWALIWGWTLNQINRGNNKIITLIQFIMSLSLAHYYKWLLILLVGHQIVLWFYLQ